MENLLYPNLIKLLTGITEHPLRDWMDNQSLAFQEASKIINDSLTLFDKCSGFEQLKKNLRCNKNRLWDYLNEVRTARALYECDRGKKYKFIFNFNIANNKDIDLLLINNSKIAIEISSMLNSKHFNLLIENIFRIVDNAGFNVEIIYENENMPELSDYSLIKKICQDFESSIVTSDKLTYLNGKISISKSNATSATNYNSTLLSEGQMLQDIQNKLKMKTTQFVGSSYKNVLIIEMQHYDTISQYYFENFAQNIEGYNVTAKKLLEEIPEVINTVVFQWSNIHTIKPHRQFIADKNTMKILESSSACDLLEYLELN